MTEPAADPLRADVIFNAPPGPIPETPTDPPVLMDAMWSLGFSPVLVQTVILTPAAAVAISVAYPEPYIKPEA